MTKIKSSVVSALIKAKTQYLADQIRKGAEKFQKHRRQLQKKRGKYTKLDPIGEMSASDSEEEIYNKTVQTL